MYLVLLIYLFVALLLPLIPGGKTQLRALVATGAQLGVFAYFLLRMPGAGQPGVFTETWRWIPEIGLDLVFTLDGLSMVFALLITGIGALVFLYAASYMKSYTHTGRFFLYLFLFSGAMLGLVLSGNMIQLIHFREFTT